MFSVPVVSSRVLTLFSSVVYLMKTDERCDLYRAVASAVTYNTFYKTNLYSKYRRSPSYVHDMIEKIENYET